MTEQTTLFYKLKLKRTKTPQEIFEKMSKAVKKKGATKNWTYTIDNENMRFCIDFGDGKSENFCLSFDDKKICNSFCKVFFPLSGELFDDEKKSEFKALINMLYSARTSFAEMKITDDYGISESFLDSKVNKIVLRELSGDEMSRAERLFADGRRDIREFITALMYDYRDMPYSEDYIPYINKRIGQCPFMFWPQFDSKDFFLAFIDSFLYETTEYKDMGRLYTVDDYYGDLNGVFFSVHAFFVGIQTLTGNFIYKKGADPKSTQVLRLYYNKLLPMLEAEKTDFGRCILSYRFFVSIMDYLGFRYVGNDARQHSLIDEALLSGVRAMLSGGGRNALWEAVKAELG